VVASARRWAGQLSTGLAGFVVVTPDGWILTAAHIFELGLQAEKDTPDAAALKAQIDAVRSDPAKRPEVKRRELRRLEGSANRTWITNHSYWWSRPGVNVVDVTLLVDADIAVARLDPVPDDLVASPAVIKNPALGLEPGRSLCRLGFPFSSPTVTYDEQADMFNLAGSISFFPLDGIFTRTINTANSTPGGAPIRFVETSSPGLRGQSGGPVFDLQGRVWGIQSATTHVPLGFNPEIDVNGRKTVVPQFINLGRAVHCETLVAVLRELGIAFTMSPD
jgi:hypothetical protein